MNSTGILGVVLVRDEDIFLARALRAAAAFCDQFLLFDHGSKDASPGILRDFASQHPSAVLHSIRHPSESHQALLPFCGTRTWVFGVDGDEVYDAAGLAVLKPRLLSGEFDNNWMIMGHCLHVEKLTSTEAVGYEAPPSRPITKLYNFAAISAWPGRSMERLHGGSPAFRPGYHAGLKRMLLEEIPWKDSPLRCLHLCFCPRSSARPAESGGRANIDEIYNGRLPSCLLRLIRRLLPSTSAWKRERYRRGPLVTRETGPFFS
ncbi:MAG: hypothetical protein Fur0032_20760 [Terrimicrobiaceae bacterium]